MFWRAAEVPHPSHRTIILATGLVQPDAQPESCTDRQFRHGDELQMIVCQMTKGGDVEKKKCYLIFTKWEEHASIREAVTG